RTGIASSPALLVRQARRPAVVTFAAAAIVFPALSTSSLARGPDNIADIAEKVIDAVVNISTSQKVETRNTPMPQLPNDPQLDELLRDFFNRRGQGDPQNRGPRRVNSLGSGFIIDPSGLVVTSNHLIARCDAGRAAVARGGEAVGIHAAWFAPSRASIGIGVSVPSKSGMPVIEQLKQFGEARRGWLGVRMQPLTADIAESLNSKPPGGAL